MSQACPQSSERYVYQVLPSYKSQTGIRIARKLPPSLSTPPSQKQQQNPYVFRPKSYSRRSLIRDRQSSSHPTPPPTKKFKFSHFQPSKDSHQNQLEKKYLLTQLADQTPFFHPSVLRENKMIPEETQFKLPLKLTAGENSLSNPLLSHKIEIVSTDNQKILVPIHQGLLKANSNHCKNEQNLEGIVNPFNSELKQHFSQQIQFIRDYKSGYTPIELQNRSKKEDEEKELNKKERHESSSKTHFIKKKQSTLSLSRTCGVSYIKPSESKQSGPFDQLPPLIFQCSTSCTYTSELKALYHSQIQKMVQLSSSRWFPAIMSNEQHMRDILLGKPFGKVIWIFGLENIWPLLNQGVFLLIFFHKEFASTEEQVWAQFNTSYFKFGVLAKKSTSGRKLFMKSIQADSLEKNNQTASVQSLDMFDEKSNKFSVQNETEGKNQVQLPKTDVNDLQKSSSKPIQEAKEQEAPSQERKQCKDVCEQLLKEFKNSRTVITMALKLEMYVQESFWKGSSRQGKNLLNAIILTFEETLQKKSLQIIRNRLEMLQKDQREELMKKALENIRFGSDISHLKQAEDYMHTQQRNFNLNSLRQLNSALELREYDMKRPLVPHTELYKDKDGKENIFQWEKALKMPIYYISTRDSFAFDLVQKITIYHRQGRPYKKIQYNFEPDNLPENYTEYKKLFPNLDTGVVCYHDFFTEEELQQFEGRTLETERSAFKNKFLHMTVQPTIIGNRIKRTKFFFGYRYMWTRCQLAEPNSYVGAGVRRDVTEPPKWVKKIENPMVEHNIVDEGFLNSVAINVYHDGSEGLAQHFDDAVRFRQPIYTLRLVSDGRLSFGSQFYGFCNGAFIIPLPRGCICVMNENSYAANGVKHCVRPCDMSGKSAAVIMRQMHHQVVREASKYDELIDFPAWLSTISEDPKAITYAEQKRRQAERLLNDDDKKKEKQEKEKQDKKQKESKPTILSSV